MFFTFNFSFVESGRIYLERRFHLFVWRVVFFKRNKTAAKPVITRFSFPFLFFGVPSFLFILLENGSYKLPWLQIVPSAKDCCSPNTPSGIIALYFYVFKHSLTIHINASFPNKTDITYILMHKKGLNESLYDIGFRFVMYITKEHWTNISRVTSITESCFLICKVVWSRPGLSPKTSFFCLPFFLLTHNFFWCHHG